MLADAALIRSSGFHAAAQWLSRLVATSGSPVVLLLEDLHWADQSSLDFVDYLLDVQRDLPLLVIASMRPLASEATKMPSRVASQTVELEPLDNASSHELAGVLLQRMDPVPAQLRELILRGAEGNPFFMEELVKMLVDRGVIEISGERWSLVADKLLAVAVPQTLTGVVQARIDGLAPSERRALQQASAIGFVFWDQALAAVDPEAIDSLAALASKELIATRAAGTIEGAREYTFGHHLLHQVVYDTLLKRERRELHARIAAWLAARVRTGEALGLIADHFERAGDRANALEYLLQAAGDAAARYAHHAVVASLTRAEALLPAHDHANRWRLVAMRERELSMQGLRSEQGAAIDELESLAEALDDDAKRGEAAWRRCDVAYATGDYASTLEAARRALAWAQRAKAVDIAMRSQQLIAAALQCLGEIAPAKEIALQALAQARANGNRAMESLLLNALSAIAGRQNDQQAGYDLDRQQLAITRELGNRKDECVALCNLGISLTAFGDLEAAQRDLEDALTLARSIGWRSTEAYVLHNLSAIALQRGDAELAQTQALASLALASQVGDRLSEAMALLRLGAAELKLDHLREAASAYARSTQVCLELKHPIALDAQAGEARVALAQGKQSQALAHVEVILSRVDVLGTLDGTDSPQLVRLSCYHVLRSAADRRAGDQLARAHGELHAEALRISDAALRNGFLAGRIENRAIAAEWLASRAQ